MLPSTPSESRPGRHQRQPETVRVRPSRRKAQALMANSSDIERRLDTLESRMAWLDEHGTRGVDSLRAQVSGQTADIGELKGRLDKIDGKIDSASRQRMSQYIGLAMALLPIYVLLFLTLFHVKPA